MQGRQIGVGELLGIGELLLARVSRSPEAGETPWDQGSCPFSKPNPLECSGGQTRTLHANPWPPQRVWIQMAKVEF